MPSSVQRPPSEKASKCCVLYGVRIRPSRFFASSFRCFAVALFMVVWQFRCCLNCETTKVRNNKSTKQRKYETTKIQNNETSKQWNRQTTKQRKYKTTKGRCKRTMRKNESLTLQNNEGALTTRTKPPSGTVISSYYQICRGKTNSIFTVFVIEKFLHVKLLVSRMLWSKWYMVLTVPILG